jgi:hypothetical protein
MSKELALPIYELRVDKIYIQGIVNELKSVKNELEYNTETKVNTIKKLDDIIKNRLENIIGDKSKLHLPCKHKYIPKLVDPIRCITLHDVCVNCEKSLKHCGRLGFNAEDFYSIYGTYYVLANSARVDFL